MRSKRAARQAIKSGSASKGRGKKKSSKRMQTSAAATVVDNAESGGAYAYAYGIDGKKVSGRGARKAKRAAAAKRSSPATNRQTAATACDVDKKPKQRVAALRSITASVLDTGAHLEGVLGVLRNADEPSAVRLAALQTLQAASFSVVKFAPHRSKYLATLRSLVKDPDPELRQRVLGILAREGDGQTQALLIEGLKKPSKALVSPEKALQLLSYDVHTDAFAVVRGIVANPPNDEARREALRVLAADATAVPVFDKILKNKKEPAEIRQLSASALHAIAPHALQSRARKIVMDPDENDKVKALSLTAITDLRPAEEGTVDDALYSQVGRVGSRSKSALVKRSATRFLKKYKR